jgi:hypothetical protein
VITELLEESEVELPGEGEWREEYERLVREFVDEERGAEMITFKNEVVDDEGKVNDR